MEDKSLAIVGVCVVIFLLATIPPSLPYMFAQSAISKISDHGVQFSERSLLASGPAPIILNSNVFRNGSFSLEFVSQADISVLGRISLLVSYSRGLADHWAIEQNGTTLVVL